MIGGEGIRGAGGSRPVSTIRENDRAVFALESFYLSLEVVDPFVEEFRGALGGGDVEKEPISEDVSNSLSRSGDGMVREELFPHVCSRQTREGVVGWEMTSAAPRRDVSQIFR